MGDRIVITRSPIYILCCYDSAAIFIKAAVILSERLFAGSRQIAYKQVGRGDT